MYYGTKKVVDRKIERQEEEEKESWIGFFYKCKKIKVDNGRNNGIVCGGGKT